MNFNILQNPFAITTPVATANRRLMFIDLLRAYAILMMLQGHFVDTVLDSVYRDPTHWAYATWAFMRGMTAPIFFFASGLIFVFLLLRSQKQGLSEERIRKGLVRGFKLILIGYALRLTFPQLLSGYFSLGVLKVDVLHCIGLAIISLLGAFALSRWARLPFPLLLLLGSFLAFFFYFDFKEGDWSALPLFLQNYLTPANGSVFTPVPWIGYAMLGGLLGYSLHHRPHWAYGPGLPIALLAAGLLTDQYSSQWLMMLHDWTGLEQFYRHADYNFLLKRLGHVFVVVAIFIWLAQLWRNIPPLLLRIGSETLVIYEVHFILLYSTWFGVGISYFWRYSLTPLQTIIGALLFLAFFVLLIANIDRIRAYRWVWWHKSVKVHYRRVRVLLWRRYHRWIYTSVSR